MNLNLQKGLLLFLIPAFCNGPVSGAPAGPGTAVSDTIPACSTPVTIWLEDFTLPDGTKADTGATPWSVTNTSPNSVFFVDSNEFRVNNITINGLGTWTSSIINIAGKTNVSLSVDVRSAGGLTSDTSPHADYLRMYYILDGGTPVLFADNEGKINNNSTVNTTQSAGSLTGATLQIVILGKATATSEYYYFDNVKVSGYAPGSISASALSNGTLTCISPSVTLQGSSSDPIASFSWAGPNGFSSTSQTPTVSAAGDYTLTATNAAGCRGVSTVTVAQNIATPRAAIAKIAGIPANTVLTCSATSISMHGLSSTSGVSFTWTGPNSFTATGPTATATAAGIYTLKVTNTSNGCFSTVNDTLTQNIATPGAAIAATPANSVLTCTATSISLAGSSSTSRVSYSWTGPNGFTASTATATATAAGIYTLKVTNPSNGCSSVVTATPVTPNIAVPSNLTAVVSSVLSCNQPSVILTASSTTSGVNYSWTGPGSFSASTSTATATLGGNYTLTATNSANGCSITKTVTVQADTAAPANITATNNGPLTCSVTSVTLTGSSSTTGVQYQWTGTDGFFDPNQVTTTSVGEDYQLLVINPANGCAGTATTTVTQDLTGCSMAAPKVTGGTAASFNQAGLTDNAAATPFGYKTYPNPASASAFIEFKSPVAGQVSVGIYNNLGVLEKVLFNSSAEAHQLYKLAIDAGQFSAGIHYCIIRTANQSYTGKLVFMKR